MSLSSAKIAAFQSAAQAKTAADERSKLMKGGVGEAAKAFEAMFIKMLLDAMPELWQRESRVLVVRLEEKRPHTHAD